MKKTILTFILFKLIVMQVGIGQVYERHERKIGKVLTKEFESVEFDIEKVQFGDSLVQNQDLEVFKINGKESVLGYFLVDNATACRVGGCPVYSRDTQSGNYELFSYFVLYDSNLNLKQVKILEYGPEYGYEITSKRWLRQFAGSKDCHIDYGEDVDAITGATISARSLIDNVNDACEILHKIILKAELGSKPGYAFP
ncbi:MAG: FMN-binding protein [Chlorobi bacterium]|nr:FMN-binding protein [Chlorobiota bacterium]